MSDLEGKLVQHQQAGEDQRARAPKAHVLDLMKNYQHQVLERDGKQPILVRVDMSPRSQWWRFTGAGDCILERKENMPEVAQ